MIQGQTDLLNVKLKMENGKLNTLKIFNFQLPIFNSRVAFTLAEVLITLGVIGVVAAMTMPTLIAKYQKHQTVTQLQKVYSTISQAVQMSISENGTPDEWNWDLDNDSFCRKYITPYFKIALDCGIDYDSDCSIKSFTFLNGRSLSTENDNLYGFITSDGTRYNVRNHRNTRVFFGVDINGKKGPNIWSKDIFQIVLDKKNSNNNYTLFFDGEQNSASRDGLIDDYMYGCSTESYYAGWFCGALIHFDGWQIKDDYPW